MAVIGRIVSRGDTAAMILFEDGSSVIVPKEIIYQFGLRKGDSPDETVIQSIQEAGDKYIIRQAALRLLGMRLHSESELRNKLLKKKFRKTLISEVISELVSIDLLNDLRFAVIYADELITVKRNGIQKARSSLMAKGIKQDIISRVIREYEKGDDYESNARALAEKKLRLLQKTKKEPKKIKQSLIQFLASRGFEFDVIRKVLNSLPFFNGENSIESE